jgi:hypothetical protein
MSQKVCELVLLTNNSEKHLSTSGNSFEGHKLPVNASDFEFFVKDNKAANLEK